MPFAMFFDWTKNGRLSGLAIHGTDETGERNLGTRASHGCIRLATRNAETLFNLITQTTAGLTPRFRYNPATAMIDTRGQLAMSSNGTPVMRDGYQVLLIIENERGPQLNASM